MAATALAYQIAILVGCFFCSAFFSASETALLSLPRARIFKLAQQSRRGKEIRRALSRPDRLLGAILLGNNFFNVAGSMIGTTMALSLWGSKGLGPTMAGLTILFLLFAEITPKTLAAYKPETISLFVITPLRAFMIVFDPLVRALSFISRSLVGVGGQSAGTGRKVTRDDFRTLVTFGGREGYLDRHEQQMLKGVLDLEQISIVEVMQPVNRIKALDASLTPAEALQTAIEWPYSRFPVYEERLEKVLGYVHLRDLLDAGPGVGLRELVHGPVFAPESRSIRDQLLAFRRDQVHMALVVDEFGQLEGLVTLEDVLEEIVGEILDEYDIKSAAVRPVADGGFLVDGRLSVRDANRLTELKLPEGPYNTVSGLIQFLAQKIPEPGDVFHWQELELKVERMDGMAVGRAKIRRHIKAE